MMGKSISTSRTNQGRQHQHPTLTQSGSPLPRQYRTVLTVAEEQRDALGFETGELRAPGNVASHTAKPSLASIAPENCLQYLTRSRPGRF